MAKKIPFQKILAALRDETNPFPPLLLYHFSSLEPAALNDLMDAWPEISLVRRHALLEDLEELAEAEPLLSFVDLACALLKDPDAQVRILAIRLLWECEDTRLVPAFMNILSADSDFHVRAAAATALGLFVYLGDMEEIPKKTCHDVEDCLLQAINSDEPVLIRRWALEALGMSSRPEVLALIETAYAQKDPDWVASAIFAMGRSSDTRWEGMVLRKIRNASPEISLEAIQAAGEIPLAAARPVLLDMLPDEEDDERRRAILWSLSKIGGEGVQECFEVLMATADEEEIEFLEDALDNLLFTEDMARFDLFDFEEEEGDTNTQ